MFKSDPPKHVDAPIESQWSQDMKPAINTADGQYTNTADSYVIMETFQQHTSILTISLIVLAVLFIIHFLVQFGLLHGCFRCVRRHKSPSNLPEPAGALPTSI